MTASSRRGAVPALGRRFARFALVGVIGFSVDAGVLLTLVRSGWTDPLTGRLASFPCAVMTTFELNRIWSFDVAPKPYAVLLARYLAVQGAGFVCNLAVYAAALVLLPAPANDPRVCLGFASGVALVINFAGAHLLVFRRRGV